MISADNITEVLNSLGKQIGAHGGTPLCLVVCGGTALNALGLVCRTTKDVDVLGTASEKNGKYSVRQMKEFPDWFKAAAQIVARDFDLHPNWINLGPASQTSMGLPDGFESRLVKREYGPHLTILYIGRVDQVHFKLFASVDRGDYHVKDLFSLSPTEDELRTASRWVLTQDVSEPFRDILKDFLEEHGHGTLAAEF